MLYIYIGLLVVPIRLHRMLYKSDYIAYCTNQTTSHVKTQDFFFFSTSWPSWYAVFSPPWDISDVNCGTKLILFNIISLKNTDFEW